MIVEVCASNYESAIAAVNGRADRIEHCAELEVGGLTPPENLVEKVISEIDLPVHVLVRPRAGNFVYTSDEIDQMIRTISICKKLGCDGIVSGILTAENNIDVSQTKLLVEASEGLHFTFHRAFDYCIDPMTAIDQLIEMGVNTLLTSGQRQTAVTGLSVLKQLKAQGKDKIVIMPGAGINDDNALLFIEAGFEAIHLSAINKSDSQFTSLMEGVSGISDQQMIQNIVAMTR